MINEYKREATRQELIDEVDRLQKEIDKKQVLLVCAQEIIDNSIPKEKIENKIKELNNKIEQYREYFIVNKETDVECYENITNLEIVRILKELLEEEK